MSGKRCHRSYERRVLTPAQAYSREVQCYGCGRTLRVRVAWLRNGWNNEVPEATLPRHNREMKR